MKFLVQGPFWPPLSTGDGRIGPTGFQEHFHTVCLGRIWGAAESRSEITSSIVISTNGGEVELKGNNEERYKSNCIDDNEDVDDDEEDDDDDDEDDDN